MARFVSGDVVVVPLPFTDLTSAALPRGDVILCQITSQATGHPEAVPILLTDFAAGRGLLRPSFAVLHRVVTANEVCLRQAVGRLKPEKRNHIRERVCAIIRQG